MSDKVKHFENKLDFETDACDLRAGLENRENIVVIDARSAQAFAAEHIPGAINIPHRQMSAESVAHLDRAALVVTYCDGIGCNASTKGALAMTRLGFRVKELVGGLEWWKRDGFPVTIGESDGKAAPKACGCGAPVAPGAGG